MRITIGRDDLVAELALADRVIARKLTLPILGSTLVRADGDAGVQMYSTDLDLSLSSACDATVLARGETTVPARKAHDLARSLADDEITLDRAVGSAAVAMTAAQFAARLQAFDVEDFPAVVAQPDGAPVVAVPCVILRTLMKYAACAMTDARDDRFWIAGAQLEIAETTVKMVATDSYRLVVAEIARPVAGAAREPLLVPSRALAALGALLAAAPDDVTDVEIITGDAAMFFVVGRRVLSARQVDGKFPAYQRVIPAAVEHACQVARTALLGSLRRAEMVHERTRLALEKDQLTVTAVSAEVGEATERLAAAYAGPAVEVGINAKSLAEFAEAAETDDVWLDVRGPSRQITARPVGGDVNVIYVMAPMVE